jgi:hypothetical protein
VLNVIKKKKNLPGFLHNVKKKRFLTFFCQNSIKLREGNFANRLSQQNLIIVVENFQSQKIMEKLRKD